MRHLGETNAPIPKQTETEQNMKQSGEGGDRTPCFVGRDLKLSAGAAAAGAAAAGATISTSPAPAAGAAAGAPPPAPGAGMNAAAAAAASTMPFMMVYLDRPPIII